MLEPPIASPALAYTRAISSLERLQKFLACDDVETSSTEHKSSHFLALIDFDNEAFRLIL